MRNRLCKWWLQRLNYGPPIRTLKRKPLFHHNAIMHHYYINNTSPSKRNPKHIQYHHKYKIQYVCNSPFLIPPWRNAAAIYPLLHKFHLQNANNGK